MSNKENVEKSGPKFRDLNNYLSGGYAGTSNALSPEEKERIQHNGTIFTLIAMAIFVIVFML